MYYVCMAAHQQCNEVDSTKCGPLSQSAYALSRVFESLWGNISVVMAQDMQSHVEKRRKQMMNESIANREESYEEMGRLMGALWALEKRAKQGVLEIRFVSVPQYRTICHWKSARVVTVTCLWDRIPQQVWGIVALSLLPGIMCSLGSLRALPATAGPSSIEILDFWRVLMGALVVFSHCGPNRHEIGQLGNSIAFALAVRLQGSASDFPRRWGMRWARQAPARIALAAFQLGVLRRLFTHDLTANSKLVGLPINGGWIWEFTKACNRVLHVYEKNFLGPLVELVEPPHQWFMAQRPMGVAGMTLWFFRTEATLWLLVVGCRSLGRFGWFLLLALFSCAVWSLHDDGDLDLQGTPDPPFPVICVGYVAASAWRQWSLWWPALRRPGSLLFLAGAFALRLALVGLGNNYFEAIWLMGFGHHTTFLLWGLHNALWFSGLEAALDVLEPLYQQLPAAAKGVMRVMSRLSLGVCLLHGDVSGLVTTWMHGRWNTSTQ